VLATLALLTARVRPLFWLFVAAFNLVGTADLFVDYYHAIRVACRRWRDNSAPPMSSRSSTCRVDDHALCGYLLAGAPGAQGRSGAHRRCGLILIEIAGGVELKRQYSAATSVG
jgi:hypothetical protein